MVVPKPRSKRLRRELPIPFRERLGIGNQTFGFLKSFEHQIALLLVLTSDCRLPTYFEYSSTMSCSFN